MRNFLRKTITALFSDFASSWRHWFTGGYWLCAAKTVSHTVLALSPSSPKVSVPPGQPDKFLKINKEVFRLLTPPHHTKILRNPNGHYFSFVKAEKCNCFFEALFKIRNSIVETEALTSDLLPLMIHKWWPWKRSPQFFAWVNDDDVYWGCQLDLNQWFTGFPFD